MSDLPALYTLASEYLDAAKKLNDLELDADTVRDTLESLQFPIEQKANNIAFVVRNLESLAEQIKAAEQQMAARRKAIEARAEHVREYLLNNMQRCGITEIECPYFRIRVKQNPVSVVIDDEKAIPWEYQRQVEPPPPAPDKKALKEALEKGIDVPGAHLERKLKVEIK